MGAGTAARRNVDHDSMIVEARIGRPESGNLELDAIKPPIPGMTQSRLLPTVLLAASSWLLISLFGSQQRLGTAKHKERLATPFDPKMVQD